MLLAFLYLDANCLQRNKNIEKEKSENKAEEGRLFVINSCGYGVGSEQGGGMKMT